MRVILILCALVLAACQTFAPNRTAAVTSDAIYQLSVEVDRAEMRGWITDHEEVDMISRLQDAQKLIIAAVSVVDVKGCDPQMTQQECAQVILLDIETKLREAER